MFLDIGRQNKLEAIKWVDKGLLLDGGPYGELFLKEEEAPAEIDQGEELEVFVYTNSRGRILVTTKVPHATVGQFARMRTVAVRGKTAYLDWGLNELLFLPLGPEDELEEGRFYLVYIYYDETEERVLATRDVEPYLTKDVESFEENQAVSVLITKETDLGYKVIVDHKCWGLLYSNEVFQYVRKGDTIKAFVRAVREDGKLDIRLQKDGRAHTDSTSQKILDYLQQNEGFLPLSDKSSPVEIAAYFEVSKKAFKKAVGALYKQKLITLEPKCIRLND